MNKLTFTLNAIWSIAILLSTLPMQSMENNVQLNEQLALAKEYSSLDSSPDCPLPYFKLEDDLIFACCQVHPKISAIASKNALEDTIKNFMKMRITCKKYHESLTFEKIGNCCKNHSCFARNQIVRDLFLLHPYRSSILSKEYLFYRPLMLISIHAEANFKNREYYLYELTIKYSDAYMLETLFKYQMIDNLSTRKANSIPLYFDAKTIEIAQVFIDNGTNIHIALDSGYNVLSHLLGQHTRISSHIKECDVFYLDDGSEVTHKSQFVCKFVCPTQCTLDLIQFYLSRGVEIPDQERDLFDKLISQPTEEYIIETCLEPNEPAQ